jgi:hypothetical protein
MVVSVARPYVTVVTGVSRSGTSLLMQMLVAGGIPPYDPDEARWPWYETRRHRISPWDVEALGCCVKVFDPCIYRPPPDGTYRFILTRRDPKQSAKSNAKFLRSMTVEGRKMPIGRAKMKAVIASIKQDNIAIEALLSGYEHAQTLKVRFEDLVRKSEPIVRKLNAFVGPLDTEAALAQVIERPTKCLPYMLEEKDLGVVRPALEEEAPD